MVKHKFSKTDLILLEISKELDNLKEIVLSKKEIPYCELYKLTEKEKKIVKESVIKYLQKFIEKYKTK